MFIYVLLYTDFIIIIYYILVLCDASYYIPGICFLFWKGS